jgi:hypothetical protein
MEAQSLEKQMRRSGLDEMRENYTVGRIKVLQYSVKTVEGLVARTR